MTKELKSGRGLGDRGECARCRNGDLIQKTTPSSAALRFVAWLFRAKSKRSSNYLFRSMITAVAGALFSIPIWGQTAPIPDAAPVIENNGRPMVVPFHCTNDDIAWAGLSCSEEEPCPVYLEISNAEAVGNQIFAAGNLHSDTVTLYSVLLASDDSGKNWREAYQRIRGAGLDRVEFADFAIGWVSGETLFPLPQDPFLLLTKDGGKTWRRQPVFPDFHPGSIQQFSFSSPTDGSLIVDQGEGAADERYALYASPDGGQTWALREMSRKPLRLAHPSEAPANWRVQADRGTQSFRIERREGERWSAAASFAVSAGACRPSSAEPTPPPATEPTLPPALPPRSTPTRRP